MAEIPEIVVYITDVCAICRAGVPPEDLGTSLHASRECRARRAWTGLTDPEREHVAEELRRRADGRHNAAYLQARSERKVKAASARARKVAKSGVRHG